MLIMELSVNLISKFFLLRIKDVLRGTQLKLELASL